jgi:hypothetical protein
LSSTITASGFIVSSVAHDSPKPGADMVSMPAHRIIAIQ